MAPTSVVNCLLFFVGFRLVSCLLYSEFESRHFWEKVISLPKIPNPRQVNLDKNGREKEEGKVKDSPFSGFSKLNTKDNSPNHVGRLCYHKKSASGWPASNFPVTTNDQPVCGSPLVKLVIDGSKGVFDEFYGLWKDTGEVGLDVSETLDEVFLPDLTPTCLGCICEATSNCNLTIGCQGRLCGPFLISKTYWIDAGRPVLYRDHPAREGAYETCVNDPYCAAQTLRQYMSRYVQDCNRNGYLDCDDYARIHYLGGRQCYLPIRQYGYYRVFKNCEAVVRFLN